VLSTDVESRNLVIEYSFIIDSSFLPNVAPRSSQCGYVQDASAASMSVGCRRVSSVASRSRMSEAHHHSLILGSLPANCVRVSYRSTSTTSGIMMFAYLVPQKAQFGFGNNDNNRGDSFETCKQASCGSDRCICCDGWGCSGNNRHTVSLSSSTTPDAVLHLLVRCGEQPEPVEI
jgi:hypothetical protein